MQFSFPRARPSLDQLVVRLEHVAEAGDLLRRGGVVRERMALVAADHLAEVLLQDFVADSFEESEALGPLGPRRYDRGERQRLANDFGARVEMARSTGGVLRSRDALLDDRDAVVFKVAHKYRNGLYHGDRHNAALGRPLATSYLQAVGRALARSWPDGMILGGYELGDPRIRALRALGAASAGTSLSPRVLVEECTNHALGRFRVQRASLAKQLEADIQIRVEAVAAGLERLAHLGFSRAVIRDGVNAALLWAAFRTDPELVRLETRQDDLRRARMGKGDVVTDDEVREYADLADAMEQRRDDLRSGFRAPVTIASTKGLLKAAAKLHQAKDIASVLDRYSGVDERMTYLEGAVERFDTEVDRMLQHAEDLARGK